MYSSDRPSSRTRSRSSRPRSSSPTRDTITPGCPSWWQWNAKLNGAPPATLRPSGYTSHSTSPIPTMGFMAHRGLTPRSVGRPRGGLLVEERGQPVAALVRQARGGTAAREFLHRQALTRTPVQELLRRRERIRPALRERLRPRVRRCKQVLRGRDLIHQPDAERRESVDEFAGE